MIAVVDRVAKRLKKEPVDLLPSWFEEVDRALAQNHGNQDSRSFCIAAINFLERHGVKMKPTDVRTNQIHKSFNLGIRR